MSYPSRLTFEKIRVAAVQAEPAFLDLEAGTRKVCTLIEQAGQAGAQLIAFPEAFLPTFPNWYETMGESMFSRGLDKALFKCSVEVPGPEIDAIAEACKAARIHAVLGINERIASSTGTMFNTHVHINCDGVVLGKHQKYVATIGERLVHGPGQTGHRNAFSAHFGTVSGLICGENSNPLAQYAAAKAYPVVHVASWPSYFAPGIPMHHAVQTASAGLAYALKCFVVCSVSRISRAYIDGVGKDGDTRSHLEAQRELKKGAMIFDPVGYLVADGTGDDADLLIADIDLDRVLIPKMIHDVAGHYNRPEIFADLLKAEPRS